MQCWKMRFGLLLVALVLQFAATSEDPVPRLGRRHRLGRPDSVPRLQKGSFILQRLRRLLEEEVVMVVAPVCHDPGTPVNGHKNPHEEETYQVGEKAIFVCNAGYTLDGRSVITCVQNSDGTASWDHPVPQCNAPPQESRISHFLQPGRELCGPPPIPFSPTIVITYNPGIEITYACIEGSRAVRGEAIVPCLDGRWKGTPLLCQRDCLDFGDIDDGMRILNGTQEGDVVSFRCSEGFDLLGSRQLVCNANGEWNGVWPRCFKRLAQCGDPGLPHPHGIREVLGTTQGDTVVYSCRKGYKLMGGAIRQCLPSGFWSGDIPQCRKLMCEPPPEPDSNGSVEYNSTEFGSVATYSCNAGYFLMGHRETECEIWETWTRPAPECKAVTCGWLRRPLFGRVRQGPTLPTFGFVANYSCFNGYGLMGDAFRICQANSTWSGFPPTCERGSCGTLPHPENGFVQLQGMTLGSHAVYSCNRGYVLSGPIVRTCGIAGTWSPGEPTCQRELEEALDVADFHITEI